MFTLNKFFIFTLMAGLPCFYAVGNIKAVEVSPEKLVQVSREKVETNRLGVTEYTFKCVAGTETGKLNSCIWKLIEYIYICSFVLFFRDTTRTARIGCRGSDRTSWPTLHDIVLTLRCPPSGDGPTIAYIEVIFTVTTQNINCVITDGGIGASHIQMEVDVHGTYLLDYAANVYIA